MNSAAVRPSVLAGTWYSDDPSKLRMSIESLLASSRPLEAAPVGAPLRGLILPHAGHKYSGRTCANGVALLRGSAVRRVILIGPSHRSAVAGMVVPEWTHFETPLGAVPVDVAAVRKLSAAGAGVSNSPHEREHCIEVLLPFFQVVLKEFSIAPILAGKLSDAERRRMAVHLRELLTDGTVIVASSDFVHYGADFDFEPDVGSDVRAGVRQIDEGAMAYIRSKDSAGLLDYRAQTGATICGILPIAILIDAIPAESVARLAHYSQSADVSGETDHMVSYASVGFFESPAGGA